MNQAPIQDDPRWLRLLQPSMYQFDPASMLGKTIVVDTVIGRMNDLARFIELCSSPPYMAGVLMSASLGSDHAAGDYWKENVIEWDDRDGGVFTVPERFTEYYNRYRFTGGLLVAPLHLTLAPDTPGGTAPLEIWNYLIFDRELNVADRLDPHPAAKPGLDRAIEDLLSRQAPLDIFTYRSPDATGAKYRKLRTMTVIPLECPEFVQYNLWTFWLLYARLFFSDHAQENVYGEIFKRLSPGDIAGDNLLINFYAEFTNDANLHVFGATDFVIHYPSKNDLWRFEPAIARRVDQVTRTSPRTSQLNQILCAAIRQFVGWDDGSRYNALYDNYIGAAPRFIPKDQGGDWWIPSEQLDAHTRGILKSGELRLGYICVKPWVYFDDAGHRTGFDHDLAGYVANNITSHYPDIIPGELRIAWVDAKAGSGTAGGPCDPVSEEQKFTLLYNGLLDNSYDAAFSGQLMLPDTNVPAGMTPEWTCATALIFTAITYTGRDKAEYPEAFSFHKLAGRACADFIDYVVTHIIQDNPIELSFFSVINPGPSPGSAQELVRAINEAKSATAKGCAVWTNGTVESSEAVLTGGVFHFVVGDATASGWQAKHLHFDGIYLDIPAVDNPSIINDPAVASPTLLPVTPFTIRIAG